MTRSTRLTSRDRRALILGAAILVAALAYRAAIPAFAALVRTGESNQLRSDRLALVLQGAGEGAAMRDTLRARRRRLDEADSLLLPAGTSARIASELGAIVRSAARSAGLEVLGAMSQSDSASSGPLHRAQVRIDAQGDISGVMQFLLLVELAPGMLDVREISLTPAEPTGIADRPEVLRVSFTIEGVARGRDVAPSAGATR